MTTCQIVILKNYSVSNFELKNTQCQNLIGKLYKIFIFEKINDNVSDCDFEILQRVKIWITNFYKLLDFELKFLKKVSCGNRKLHLI